MCCAWPWSKSCANHTCIQTHTHHAHTHAAKGCEDLWEAAVLRWLLCDGHQMSSIRKYSTRNDTIRRFDLNTLSLVGCTVTNVFVDSDDERALFPVRGLRVCLCVLLGLRTLLSFSGLPWVALEHTAVSHKHTSIHYSLCLRRGRGWCVMHVFLGVFLWDVSLFLFCVQKLSNRVDTSINQQLRMRAHSRHKCPSRDEMWVHHLLYITRRWSLCVAFGIVYCL